MGEGNGFIAAILLQGPSRVSPRQQTTALAKAWVFIVAILLLMLAAILNATAAGTAIVCDGGQTGYMAGTISKDKTMVRFWLTRSPSDVDWTTDNLLCAIQPKMRVMVLGESKEM